MVRSEPTRGGVSEPVSGVLEQVVMVLVEAAFRLIWRLMKWAVLFPTLSVPFLLCGVAAWRFGPSVGFGCFLLWLLILLAMRLLWPACFRRFVSRRIWVRWRAWSQYRSRWPSTCALHGLNAALNNEVLVPELKRIVIGSSCDVLTVRMLPGQSTVTWQKQADALAHAFSAQLARVRGSQPGWVEIEVQYRDPLAAVLPLPGGDPGVQLVAVPLGVSETGSPWLVRLLGRHLLVAGATGAGKGGVVWSLLAGIGSAIGSGQAQVWVIDPKGGMEFGAGQSLFSRFAYDTGEATLSLLRDAAAVLSERAERLRGISRQHEPSVEEPLIVVVIDEIASLTAYITDRKIKLEVEQLLGLLLSQGRAVGVSVVACVQDPSKEVLALRQLFPTRIALRLTEATQAAMVLGQAARDRGALCELIPDSLPGVGYVAEDGSAEVVRVRAFHVTDDDIARIVETYRPTA